MTYSDSKTEESKSDPNPIIEKCENESKIDDDTAARFWYRDLFRPIRRT